MDAQSRCALALAACSSLIGCLTLTPPLHHIPGGEDASNGPSSAPPVDMDTDTDGQVQTASPSVAAKGPGKSPAAAWPSRGTGLVDVTALRFARPDLVQVGFANGTLADLDLATNKPRIRMIEGGAAPIVKISDTGRWVVVNSQPPRLIDVDKGDILMELTRVDRVSATTFASDDSRWYVAGSDGKLRVWNRKKLVATMAGDDVRSVLERQQADLTAALGDLREPFIGVGASSLYFGDESGDVMVWDVSGQDIDTLMSLESPLRSMAYNGTLLAVTTADGRLRVLDQKQDRLLPWTTQGRGTLVALSSSGPERVAVAHDDKVVLHDARSGAALWTTKLPPGDRCGLGLAAGDGPVAVCVAGQVGILEGPNGALRAVARQRGDHFEWP